MIYVTKFLKWFMLGFERLYNVQIEICLFESVTFIAIITSKLGGGRNRDPSDTVRSVRKI